jgi:hypothetical protein
MKKLILLLYILTFVVSCTLQKNQIFIVSDKDNQEAGKELAMYLSKTYSELSFQVSDKSIEGEKNIIFNTISDQKFVTDEQYQISGEGDELIIQGKTRRSRRFAIGVQFSRIDFSFSQWLRYGF